jgi:hypothetical protein
MSRACLRRAEIGIHHHIAGAYLLRYAQESSWQEDNRRASNGDQVSRVAALAMKRGKSVDFTGYWQRHGGPGSAQSPNAMPDVPTAAGATVRHRRCDRRRRAAFNKPFEIGVGPEPAPARHPGPALAPPALGVPAALPDPPAASPSP